MQIIIGIDIDVDWTPHNFQLGSSIAYITWNFYHDTDQNSTFHHHRKYTPDLKMLWDN